MNYFLQIDFSFKLGFRKWWTSLPQKKRTIFIEHLKRNKFKYIFVGSSTTTATILYYQMHIQETPITHRRRFILFSSNQLNEIENLEKDQVENTNFYF